MIPSPARHLPRRWPTELCLVHAPSPAALAAEVDRLLNLLPSHSDAFLCDIAYTLNQDWHPSRPTVAVITDSIADLARKLDKVRKRFAEPSADRIKDRKGVYYFWGTQRLQGKLAYLFPGEGSQYPHMLKDLCLAFPRARRAFDLVDRGCLDAGADVPPSTVIFPPPGAVEQDALWEMAMAIEAVSASGAALRWFLEGARLPLDAVVGHSSGEFVALDVAGVLRLETEAEQVRFVRDGYIQLRRLLARTDLPQGILLTVGGVDRTAIDGLLHRHPQDVLVAIENCPHQYVLCARPEVADSVVQAMTDQRAIVATLPYQRPYHTPWFESTLESLHALYGRYPLHPPRIDLYSCASAARFPQEIDGIRELCVTQWARPVRFRETIEAMYEDGVRFFLEVGPRGNLTSFVDDILRDRDHVAVASDVTHRSSLTQLQHALGMLAAQGIRLDPLALHAHRKARVLDLQHRVAPDTVSVSSTTMVLSPAFLPVMSANAIAPIEVETAPAPTSPPAPAAPIPSPAKSPDDTGHPVVQAYFTTMEMMLQSQQDIIGRILHRPLSPTASHHTPEPPRPARFPLLGAVVRHEEGRSIEFESDYRPDHEAFLYHHCFPGDSVSLHDGTLLGLPIMPLTVSLEALSEAAAYLVPGKRIVGLRQVRAARWISFEQGHRNVRIAARVQEQGGQTVVRADIRDAQGSGPGGRIRPALVEASVVLADDYPKLLHSAPLQLSDAMTCRWTTESIYPENLFHGPMLQGIRSMTRWGDNGMEGTVEVLPRDQLFRHTSAPDFEFDPILLDAVGAMLYIWLDCEGPRKKKAIILPFQVQEIRFGSPPLPVHSRLRVELRVTNTSSMSAAAHIRALDDQGRIVQELIGWEGRVFDVGTSLHGLFHQPTRHYISRRVPLPTQLASVDPSALACECSSFTLDFLQSSHGMWQMMLAFSMFDREDREAWKHFSADPSARTRWLLERMVMKEAVRYYIEQHHDIKVASPDVKIQDAGNHCHAVVGPGQARIEPTLTVLAGSRNDLAVAVVSATSNPPIAQLRHAVDALLQSAQATPPWTALSV